MSIGRSPHRYPLIVTNKHAWHINPQFLGLSVPLKIYQIIGLHPTLPSTSMQLGLMHRPGKWLCRNGITIHTGIPLFGTTLLFWLMSQRRDVLIIRWSRRMLRPVFLCLMVFVTYLDLCFFPWCCMTAGQTHLLHPSPQQPWRLRKQRWTVPFTNTCRFNATDELAHHGLY